MEYANLGCTGLKVSRICLGMLSYGDPSWWDWVLPEDEARPFVRRALEAGINFFDTADAYSNGLSEEIAGRALRDFAKRDEVVIATKVFFPMGDGREFHFKPNQGGLSRKHIFAAIDASLRRLGTDYVDLYQIHRWDSSTPIAETLEALNDLVRMGKIRYLGASSMYAWQFSQALYLAERHGWTPFVSMQNLYNLTYREEEREMLPLCRDQGIGVIPWGPLAGGFLTRRPIRQLQSEAATARARWESDPISSDNDFAVAEGLGALAERRGLPMAQIGLAWLLHQPGVTAAIVGATKPHHLEDAIAAVNVALSNEERAELEAPYTPRAVGGF
jgi:1-deoxyxylulose-5-phosphate synthase